MEPKGSPGGEARPELRAELLDRLLDGIAIVRQSDGVLVYANPALRSLLASAGDELDVAVGELVRSGRTDAVELAHPDLGAIRLIIVPRDTRRPAERAWRRDLRRELARARRRAWPLAVAAIALDAGGSTQVAAAAWAAVLRTEDSLTAHEAGAYLVVLPDCPLDSAHDVAARMQKATPSPSVVSVGVAGWVVGEQLESLASRVLDALADARAAGGNQVVQAPARGIGQG